MIFQIAALMFVLLSSYGWESTISYIGHYTLNFMKLQGRPLIIVLLSLAQSKTFSCIYWKLISPIFLRSSYSLIFFNKSHRLYTMLETSKFQIEGPLFIMLHLYLNSSGKIAMLQVLVFSYLLSSKQFSFILIVPGTS